MISAKAFLSFLKKRKFTFFSGVPDSVLKNFTNILDNDKKIKHIIATNEGSAISVGLGYHLATKKIPCIYMQNSGLGNAFNPLISIAHKKVYSIPLLLIIGWRGSPKLKDEAQHKAMGQITKKTLKLMNIETVILKNGKNFDFLNKKIKNLKSNNKTLAILIKPNTFSQNQIKEKKEIKNEKLKRSDFLKHFLKVIPINSKIISTTGFTSREIFQIRNKEKLKRGEDFYMVGGMGHSSMVSLGYSLNQKRKTICIDGDGSLLMHMGSIRTSGFHGKKNFKYVLLNNNSHESVGGQTTNSYGINFRNLFKSLGYKNYYSIKNTNLNSKMKIKKFLNSPGPSILEVIIDKGHLDNLGRPKNLIKIKNNFYKK